MSIYLMTKDAEAESENEQEFTPPPPPRKSGMGGLVAIILGTVAVLGTIGGTLKGVMADSRQEDIKARMDALRHEIADEQMQAAQSEDVTSPNLERFRQMTTLLEDAAETTSGEEAIALQCAAACYRDLEGMFVRHAGKFESAVRAMDMMQVSNSAEELDDILSAVESYHSSLHSVVTRLNGVADELAARLLSKGVNSAQSRQFVSQFRMGLGQAAALQRTEIETMELAIEMIGMMREHVGAWSRDAEGTVIFEDPLLDQSFTRLYEKLNTALMYQQQAQMNLARQIRAN